MEKEIKIAAEKSITKQDLNRLWWRWLCFQESCISYERLQAPGFLYAQAPTLKKLYGDNQEEMIAACKRHLQFYNSEPYFGLAIHGVTLALEEERANGMPVTDDTINNLKTGLMGPLAGLGDTIRAGTIAPIVTAFAISFGEQGNIIAPFLLIGLMCVIVWPVSRLILRKSYETGKEGIQEIFQSGLLKKVMLFASTLGSITLGALAASYVSLSSPAVIQIGQGSTIALQTDVFDKILLNALPLSMTFLVVFLLNKKLSATQVILVIAAIVVVGCVIGLF